MTAARFAPKKAVRRGQKARVAIAGPSGSGKTWTSLETAVILAAGAPVLCIDTERGSASLYADFYEFDTIEFEPPFDPRDLADVIGDYALKYGAIVVDSLSHFWEGEGGTRDIVDAAAARAKGNSFAGWKEGTPAQNDMVAAILQAPTHIVATMRSKTEYVLEVDSRGRQVPKKVGMAPIQRAGIEYEFTVTAEMDIEHRLLIDKTRCHALSGRMFTQGHTSEMGKALAEWLSSAEAAAPTVAAATATTAEARDARMAEWAKALDDTHAEAWKAWKLEQPAWFKSDDGRNDAHEALAGIYAACMAAAQVEPFDVVDAELVDEPTVDPSSEVVEPVSSPPARPARPEGGSVAAPATTAMIRKLQLECNAIGLADRAARLAWASDELGRMVLSFNDLDRDEASFLITVAVATRAHAVEDEGGAS